MQYNISGADQETGDEMNMQIEAADEVAAREIASRKGILVAHVYPAAMSRPAVPYRTPSPQPTLEQGHYQGAPVINVATPRRGNSLGVVSLILGIVAFLICWIPLVNLLGVPLSALGLILGLIGILVALTRNGASIGFPIAGTAICGLALFVAISMTGALVSGLKKAGDDITRDAELRNATNQTTGSSPVVAGASDSQKPGQSSPAIADPTLPATFTPPPAPKNPEVEWASAEAPVKQGDTQIQVKSVRVSKVPLKGRYGDGNGESKDVLLMIELEVSNLGENKKLEYRTWGGTAMSFGTRTALTDNFDNRYKVINFGFGNEVVGAVESESIYPGKSLRDVLVFEEPIGKVEYLNLELPATQFGGEGMLRIRIPASMISR